MLRLGNPDSFDDGEGPEIDAWPAEDIAPQCARLGVVDARLSERARIEVEVACLGVPVHHQSLALSWIEPLIRTDEIGNTIWNQAAYSGSNRELNDVDRHAGTELRYASKLPAAQHSAAPSLEMG